MILGEMFVVSLIYVYVAVCRLCAVCCLIICFYFFYFVITLTCFFLFECLFQ